MKETNWKSIVKNIILSEVKEAHDHTDLMIKLNNQYRITNAQLNELGFEYAVEIKKGDACDVYLYADKKDAVGQLHDEYLRWVHIQRNIHHQPLTHVYIDEEEFMTREAETPTEVFLGEVYPITEKSV